MSDRLRSDIIISKMLTNCFVFLCKKKDKREDVDKGIHFFFRFPDDEHLETVALRHNMRPWPLFFGNAGDKSFLEAF